MISDCTSQSIGIPEPSSECAPRDFTITLTLCSPDTITYSGSEKELCGGSIVTGPWSKLRAMICNVSVAAASSALRLTFPPFDAVRISRGERRSLSVLFE